MVEPTFSQFERLARDHDIVPLTRRMLSDALTPVSGFVALDPTQERAGCLFESVIGGEKVGRYSIVAVDPFLRVEARGREVKIVRGDVVETIEAPDPLEVVRRHLHGVSVAPLPGLPPFAGGAVGYAGYDVVRYVERLPNPPEDDRGLPDLAFGWFDEVVVFDNVQKTMSVVALARIDDRPLREIYAAAVDRLEALVRRLSSASELAPRDIPISREIEIPWESNTPQADFEAAVARSVEYIRAGDIFQVVLSQRLRTRPRATPLDVYRTLRVVNPSPFMFLLRLPGATLVGSSPEIMCRVQERQVTVRPLAGTRRRGKSDDEDRRLAEDLLADPKERAEHVMLVDLGRNDVGRVAEYGSVRLDDVMVIERYSHVMHITSNVTGALRPDLDAFDALRASLPAGTVSGAPKVRAMEIIDELERHRRGPYAGAVGYFDYSGNMDTCIALRTIVMHADAKGPIADVQAGAGIVADSVPETEYEETLNKARGLLKAIALAESDSD